MLAPTLSSGAPIFSLYTPQLTVRTSRTYSAATAARWSRCRHRPRRSRYQYDAAYLTLIANVVTTAVQQAGLRAQIDATQQVIDMELESFK